MNGEFRSFYSDKKVDRTNRSAAKGREHALDVRLDDNISQNPEIAKLGSQQTDAALANTSRKYRNASEFYRNIIAKVLNYKLPGEKNPENASSTDKNGPSAAPDGAMEGKRTEVGQVGQVVRERRALYSHSPSAKTAPALHTLLQNNCGISFKKTSPC